MNIRTSVTHPLRIDSVKACQQSGEIGMTLCPGKHQQYALTGSWHRDLNLDIKAIKHWGARILISLNEAHEFEQFSVPNLPYEVNKFDIKWLHLPIKDRGIPDEKFESMWKNQGNVIKSTINSGSRIVIHCLGGLGRTGLVSTRLLIEMGIEPDKAIELVRNARPGAIETYQQESYIRNLSND